MQALFSYILSHSTEIIPYKSASDKPLLALPKVIFSNRFGPIGPLPAHYRPKISHGGLILLGLRNIAVKFLEIPEMASNPLPQQNNGEERGKKKLPIISLNFILIRKGEDFAEGLI
jgi:hypothetical protein